MVHAVSHQDSVAVLHGGIVAPHGVGANIIKLESISICSPDFNMVLLNLMTALCLMMLNLLYIMTSELTLQSSSRFEYAVSHQDGVAVPHGGVVGTHVLGVFLTPHFSCIWQCGSLKFDKSVNLTMI